MKYGRGIITSALLASSFACGDPDADLRNEFHEASLALAGQIDPDEPSAIAGREGWILHSGEVRYLTAKTYVGDDPQQFNDSSPPEYADPVPAIVGFHRQLQKRGVELYFVPVPERPVIFPESVLGREPFDHRETTPNLHPFQQEVVSVLREHGVRVIDLTQTLLSQRTSPKGRSVYYPSETHWTPYGLALAARELAAEIKKKPWFDDVPKHRFRQRWIWRDHRGEMFRDYKEETGIALDPDRVSIRRIWQITDEGRERLELQYPQSPVVVMGDSNTTFWGKLDSALPHHLAFELGFPVDMLSARGGGANETRINLIRQMRAEPDYLADKRLVIWCLSARTFTNARQGWVPIDMD